MVAPLKALIPCLPISKLWRIHWPKNHFWSPKPRIKSPQMVFRLGTVTAKVLAVADKPCGSMYGYTLCLKCTILEGCVPNHASEHIGLQCDHQPQNTCFVHRIMRQRKVSDYN